jgi:hypothetical protein
MISGDIRGGAVARGVEQLLGEGGQFTRPMRAHCTEVENSQKKIDK